MIYRIQVEQQLFVSKHILDGERIASLTRHRGHDHHGDLDECTLGGPGCIHPLADIMWAKGLKSPELANKRLRFWFTEAGWKRVGLLIVANVNELKIPLRVIRQKNPPESRIVYRDGDQIALLPPPFIAKK